MLAGPFTAGVGIYVFYALQPYLLELHGDPNAYWVAGTVAAIVAGGQIVGGLLAPTVRSLFKSRTSILLLSALLSSALIALIGLSSSLFVVIALTVLWALMFAARTPIRQAFINELIPSKQRATVLSFDSLISSGGGVITQPLLGKSADVYSYSISFFGAAIIQFIAVPFLLLCRKTKPKADPLTK